MIPVSSIFSVGKFLWRYKEIIGVVVAVLVIGGTIYFDKKAIAELTETNTTLQRENKEYAKSLEVLRQSHARQVEALTAEAAAEGVRDADLNTFLEEVESNAETITCPVPVFVRDAFERM